MTSLGPRCVNVQRTDPQLLAQFYYADEELNQVATELDGLDGRKDPQRCTLLVNQFRSCQVSINKLTLYLSVPLISQEHILNYQIDISVIDYE